MDGYSIISNSQYGFCKGGSSELALVHQKEIVLENFEDRNIMLGIFGDLSKAFNCLSHGTSSEKFCEFCFSEVC